VHGGLAQHGIVFNFGFSERRAVASNEDELGWATVSLPKHGEERSSRKLRRRNSKKYHGLSRDAH
jgi:hypothetical protein